MARAVARTAPFAFAVVAAWTAAAGLWEFSLAAAGMAAATMAAGVVGVVPLLREGAQRDAASEGADPDRELAALRQYVPTPIAERIARAESIDCGEREVTVMFVDLHGYTAFADHLSPDEVFAFISLFTEVVCGAVRKEGGFVVEFNGDGMMAVFGAPARQHDKERAALRAARASVAAVASIEIPNRSGPDVPDVGIGIATGPAFVGNIRAADRWIWSAVGSTTNLASRLQSLAHQLSAPIVIDARTQTAAGPEPELVRLPNVRIRGLSTPVDLYAQPASKAGRARPDRVSSRRASGEAGCYPHPCPPRSPLLGLGPAG